MTDSQTSTFMSPPSKEDLARLLGINELKIEWLAGDGSDRSYFRLISKDWDQPYVLMQLSGSDAEALQKDSYDWTDLCLEIRTKTKIHTPEIKAIFKDYGCLVIEDYGNKTFEQVIKKLLRQNDFSTTQAFYKQAFDILLEFLKLDEKTTTSVWIKRGFDFEKFSWEFDFFFKHFIVGYLSLDLGEAEKLQLKEDFVNISKYLSQFSHYFTHRDFHSRNIMVCTDQKIAVIDFQDGRLGPLSYDAVSLVFDSYVPLKKEQRLQLMKNFTTSLPTESLQSAFEEQWKPILIQRQLKAIGSFSYLSFVKKRGNYMIYVDEALETIFSAHVYDKRWPFLSSTFLEKIKIALQGKSYNLHEK